MFSNRLMNIKHSTCAVFLYHTYFTDKVDFQIICFVPPAGKIQTIDEMSSFFHVIIDSCAQEVGTNE